MESKLDYDIDLSRKDVNSTDKCPILYALNIIGQKWKLPILWYLHEKKNTRWAELKHRLPGVTNMMLTKSLKELEEAGLVHREDYNEVPPHVDYSLTQRGQDLLPTLNQLYSWGEEQMEINGDE
jgi:DNA-binding HxlR family transcriptional regulator